MTAYTESGNLLPLISLGGIISDPGKGRQFNVYPSRSIDNAAYYPVLADNPRRIACVIQNPSTTISVALGTASWQFVLLPGGSIQFDTNLPYTGALVAQTNSATPSILNIIEISV